MTSFKGYDDWKTTNPEYEDDDNHSDECVDEDCDGNCVSERELDYDDYGFYNLRTGAGLDY